jgi:hypothetical protein
VIRLFRSLVSSALLVVATAVALAVTVGVLHAETGYDHAVTTWTSPEEVNAWIAANFSYDAARAMQLSATQRATNPVVPIYEPSAFFETGSGVCVDLARFGVETLRRIAPDSHPRYLMLELEPLQVRGNTRRLHWLVSFRRDDKLFFFADSKRPGHIAGPYDDVQAFVADYATDGRRVMGFREVETYEKPRRARAATRRPAPAAP